MIYITGTRDYNSDNITVINLDNTSTIADLTERVEALESANQETA